MRALTPHEVSELGRYKQWKPDSQELALDLLKQRQAKPWRPFYCTTPDCNGHPHCVPAENTECPAGEGHRWVAVKPEEGPWSCRECGVVGTLVDKWAWEHGRADQHPPRWLDDWMTWAQAGGRGSGKTRSGSEVTHKATELTGRIIMVAPTGPDFRDTMVEGVSGILATSPPGKRPTWESSKKQLTWPNGCIGKGYSAEEPDRLRGPASGFIWADEPAHYPNLQLVWDNMLYGHREVPKIGDPKVVITSTPKPTKPFRKILEDPLTVVHRVSSYANTVNLADSFKRNVLARHEGTRMGRQEIHGEVLEDVEGALWQWDMFLWVDVAPELKRIVVAVDPAGTANKRSDETGIVVVGIGFDDCVYVLQDATGKYSPHGWGTMANSLYESYSADAIVAEKNFGADMVRYVLETAGHKGARVIEVNSRRGKQIRAEPVVALYEKNRVKHLRDTEGGNRTAELEDEQTTWVPSSGMPSPNRVDALVHGVTNLAKGILPVTMSAPADVIKRHAPTSRWLGRGNNRDPRRFQ